MAKRELTRPTDATIKRLFARSGNRCAFPKCPVEIVQGDTLVAKCAKSKRLTQAARATTQIRPRPSGTATII